VEDRFVAMSEAEHRVYESVEDYISSTYNAAAATERTAVGFVMTIYRRRLASSFHALARTLANRLRALSQTPDLFGETGLAAEEDVLDDEIAGDVMDAEDAQHQEQEALMQEERGDIQGLLARAQALPTDTKARALLDVIHELREAGFRQTIVFTQYTDTVDFLRDELTNVFGPVVMCFSGRGGETPTSDGGWRTRSRDVTKQWFREGRAEILICTDAAAEGLNFQFCGTLVNYDMPWNPMRVEQRIGRIDRLGQQYPRIRIINLHYEDTVETAVYMALRERISLFETFVGRLQPILAKLPQAIARVTLGSPAERDQARSALVEEIAGEVNQAEQGGFDLDALASDDLELPERAPPHYGWPELERLLQHPELLPPGIELQVLGPHDMALLAPGMEQSVRITTNPRFFEEHAESLELWGPGCPLFPEPEIVATREEVAGMVEEATRLLREHGDS